jgi:tripartite-type tricarboxylate transporter receptor subunit TctC
MLINILKRIKIMFRKLLATSLIFVSASVFAWQPTKTVEITVPFPPASGNDLVIRPLAEVVEKNTGVKFIIVNKAGAGGVVGNMSFVNKPADGHHINIVSVGGVAAMDYISPTFWENPPYNASSFTYAAALGQSAVVIIANKNDPVSNPKELVDVLLKEKNVTLGESGGAGRLALETVLINIDADKVNPSLVRVPFKGPSETVNSVLGGHIRFGSVPLVVAFQSYLSKDLKIVGIVQQETIKGLDIPSFSSVNKNIDSNIVWGIALPKGATKEMLEWYAKAFNEAQKDPKVREVFAGLQIYSVEKINTPETFTKFVMDQNALHAKTVEVIKQSMQTKK